ncbi:hypothetical protein M1563_03795 [Patescibacteria group bacterium]|nr:hypothetical protein [Patescibacteria group bacterium]
MSQKYFFQVLGFIFSFKTGFGLIYLMFGWQATISGWVLPNWLVGIAVLIDGYFAYLSFKFKKVKR